MDNLFKVYKRFVYVSPRFVKTMSNLVNFLPLPSSWVTGKDSWGYFVISTNEKHAGQHATTTWGILVYAWKRVRIELSP